MYSYVALLVQLTVYMPLEWSFGGVTLHLVSNLSVLLECRTVIFYPTVRTLFLWDIQPREANILYI